MLTNFIGQKIRVVVYKNNELQIDMICRKLDDEVAALFTKFKFLDYHKTKVTGLNVIELLKE